MSKRVSMPAYDTNLNYRGAARTPRTRLLIACGAAGTEPQYIRALNSHLRNRAVHVKVIEKGRAPSQVVAYGIKKATALNDSYDQLWCVTDVDNFTDLDEAARLARTAPIPTTLIVSNPCFELWLLLHFVRHHRHIGNPAQAKTLLRKYAADYAKQIVDFEKRYVPQLPNAIENAKVLDPTGEATGLNPSTNMWRLVLAMGWPEPRSRR